MKDNITNYINSIDATDNLSVYDISSFNAYNSNSYLYNFYEMQKMNPVNFQYIYLLYDKFTDTFDLIRLKNLLNVSYHTAGIQLTQSNQYSGGSISLYEGETSPKSTYITNNIYITQKYPSTENRVKWTTLKIFNYTTLNSQLAYFSLNYRVYNTVANVETSKAVTLSISDFTTVGNDIIFNLMSLCSTNEVVTGNISYGIL